MKEDMHDELVNKVHDSLVVTFNKFFQRTRSSYLSNSVKLTEYHKVLTSVLELANDNSIDGLIKEVTEELDIANRAIVDYHNKEIDKITDLDKISNMLEMFATKDKENLVRLFDKIYSHPKIISENLDRMDKWVVFVDRVSKLGICTDSIIRLVEKIIMAKIDQYAVLNNLSKLNEKSVNGAYMQCLQVFLLTNLDRNFTFKRLYMYLSHCNKYSNRNLPDILRDLTETNYHDLLKLEHKLADLLCDVEEQHKIIKKKQAIIDI